MLDENQLQKLRQCLASHTIMDVVQLPDSAQLPDSTEKYFILTADETFILLISSETSPLIVKSAGGRAATRSHSAPAPAHGGANRDADFYRFYGPKELRYLAQEATANFKSHSVEDREDAPCSAHFSVAQRNSITDRDSG